MTFFLRLAQRILTSAAAVATILALFTAMQFNLRGAGLLAVLASAFYTAARAIGWVLAGFVRSDRS